MVLTDRGARFDGVGGDAVVGELERDGVLGAGERGVGRVLVAHHQREGDIAWRLVPHGGRARLDRILRADDGGQRFVVDLDQFGGVARLRRRFRDHERDAVADRAHFVGHQDGARRSESLRAAHVLGHRRRERAEFVGCDIGACEHGQHAGCGFGLRGVDLFDPRVSMRRHQHDAVALPRQVDVVDVAAAAGDEAGVLDPGHGLTNAELVHALLLRTRFFILPAIAGQDDKCATLYPRLTAGASLVHRRPPNGGKR